MTDPIAGSAPAVDLGGFPADLSPRRLSAVVHHLAADRFTGRRIGTPGGAAAATWLAAYLRELGATVTLDPVGGVSVRELYATPTLRCSDGSAVRDLVHRRDFAEHLASADLPTAVPAPLALPGAIDLAAGWVLAPGYTPAAAARASAAGAIGMLVPRGVDGDGWMPKMIAGPAPAEVAVLSVRTDLHQLMSAATGTVSVTGSVPLRTVHTDGINVYAVFAEPSDGAPSILLSAHYDGVGDDPDVRLPAACDNASGVSVVIEAARILARTVPIGVGLAIALLDGEEAGARAPRIMPRRSHPAHTSSTSTAPPISAKPLRLKPVGRPTGCSRRSIRPAAPPGCRCGPGRCHRTTAATPQPACRRSGSGWGCPATKPLQKPRTASM